MATTYLKDKQRLKGIRYMLLCISAVNAFVSILFCIISSFGENSIPTYLQSFIIGIFAYIIPIVAYAKSTNITVETASKRFFLKKCGLGYIIFGVLIGVSCQFVTVLLNLPVNMLFNNTSSYLPHTPLELIVSIIAMSIIPAFFEEFLFRGIVVGSMVEFNSKASIIFSAIIFAILHANIYGFLGYLLLGIILAVSVRRTNSLYPAIAIHFANNTTALLLGYFNEILVYEPAITVSMFTVAALAFVFIWITFLIFTKKPQKTEMIKTSLLLEQSFVNLPILLSIGIVIVAYIIINKI